jgi:hypothetical protein
MTELIIENDIEKKKMEGLLFFLKSWDIEATIRQIPPKYRVINKSHALSDEQLAENLSGVTGDISSCSESDCREIKSRREKFSAMKLQTGGFAFNREDAHER